MASVRPGTPYDLSLVIHLGYNKPTKYSSGGMRPYVLFGKEKRMASADGQGGTTRSAEVTRMRVLHRGVELTGQAQARNLPTGKIDRSAEALREQHS